jgi:hypothetical protein
LELIPFGPAKKTYSGREVRRQKGFDANSPRRVGLPRVDDFGLRADADQTEARNEVPLYNRGNE